MANENETPPEVLEEAQRRARRDFVRQVNGSLADYSPASILPKQEQAEILRRVADQLEKSDERTGVLASSQRRLEEKYQPASFFTGQERHRAYWDGRAKPPNYKAGTRAAEVRKQERVEHWRDRAREKAAEHQPMSFFAKEHEQEPERDR